MTGVDKIQLLKSLKKKCLSCSLCPLHENAVPIKGYAGGPCVFGSGSVSAEIMLVGQNPGLNEIKEKRPFVGVAGKHLNSALAAAGLDRAKLYITNSVLCYTVSNAMPGDLSVERCKEYLSEQIEIVNPRAVVVMGKSASRSFVSDFSFSVAKCEEYRVVKTDLHPVVVFTVHPMYAVYNERGLDILTSSLLTAKNLINYGG